MIFRGISRCFAQICRSAALPELPLGAVDAPSVALSTGIIIGIAAVIIVAVVAVIRTRRRGRKDRQQRAFRLPPHTMGRFCLHFPPKHDKMIKQIGRKETDE